MWIMPDRPKKITFAKMRESGARGLLVYCADYCCRHSIAVSGDGWPDDVSPFCVPSLRLRGTVERDRRNYEIERKEKLFQ